MNKSFRRRQRRKNSKQRHMAFLAAERPHEFSTSLHLLSQGWSREVRFRASNLTTAKGRLVGPVSEVFQQARDFLTECGKTSGDIEWTETFRLLDTTLARALAAQVKVKLHQKRPPLQKDANLKKEARIREGHCETIVLRV